MVGPRRKRALARKRADDRSYRQIENYYRQQGYSPRNIEELAEGDFQLAQRLNRRKRGPLDLNSLPKIEN